MIAPLLLAVETSCDETAVAILRGRSQLLASKISSQIALHEPHGGIVPEVASRNHLLRLPVLLREALAESDCSISEIAGFAATSGPGLASSLMIGLSAAKGMAIAAKKPFFAVNHLEGHLVSPFFLQDIPIPPCVALIASGGHTLLIEIRRFDEYRILGKTVDDAAGEAFDKVAKMIGLPYPGGPQIERLARLGDPAKYPLPRSMMGAPDFSFSGLKTAVRYLLPKLTGNWQADLCASFQEAVVEVLVKKSLRAVRACGLRGLAVSGGVSCNGRLRSVLATECAKENITLHIAAPALCTDNAAMIGSVAMERLLSGKPSQITDDIDPNLPLVDSLIRNRGRD